MSKLKYTEFEKQMNSVLKHQDKALADIHFPSLDKCCGAHSLSRRARFVSRFKIL